MKIRIEGVRTIFESTNGRDCDILAILTAISAGGGYKGWWAKIANTQTDSIARVELNAQDLVLILRRYEELVRKCYDANYSSSAEPSLCSSLKDSLITAILLKKADCEN